MSHAVNEGFGCGVVSSGLASDDMVLSDFPSEGILRLCLNRPKDRNSLSLEMISVLHDHILRAGSDKSIRVMILRSSGPVFCSGHNLKEITSARSGTDKGQQFFLRLMESCSALMTEIMHSRLPVIAEISGGAAAAGCQLVSSCDLAIASEEAFFVTPGVNIGLFCSTPMVALSRIVSRKHALEMLLTGNKISASRAYEIGLVNKVVPVPSLSDEVLLWAQHIASRSGAAVRIGKEAFHRQLEMSVSDAYDYCGRVMVHNLLDSDSEEGISSFIEKRSPHWPSLKEGD